LASTRLQQVFVAVLDLEPDAVTWSDLRYRHAPGWDSVAHMQLVGEIEDCFGIMIETEDVIAMDSYEKCLAILAKYGVADA
jgi:acyl carrier protein